MAAGLAKLFTTVWDAFTLTFIQETDKEAHTALLRKFQSAHSGLGNTAIDPTSQTTNMEILTENTMVNTAVCMSSKTKVVQ